MMLDPYYLYIHIDHVIHFIVSTELVTAGRDSFDVLELA